MPRRLPEFRRRPPFTVVLVAVVVGLLVIASGAIGGLSILHARRSTVALVSHAMGELAELTVGHTRAFLAEAEQLAAMGPGLVERGVLDPGDADRMGRYFLEVVRAHPRLAWASYGGVDDRFVGAWRDSDGRLLLNHSWPEDGAVQMREHTPLEDGAFELVRSSADYRYWPTRRDWWKQTAGARELSWTEPYEFLFSGGVGITCAVPLLGDADQVVGVFTIDFFLEGLSDFLGGLEVTEQGEVYILTAAGVLVAGSDFGGASLDVPLPPVLRGAFARYRQGDDLDLRVEVDGVPYLARFTPFVAGDANWLVAVVVPESDFMAGIRAQQRQALILGVVALLFSLAAGAITGRWITRPLVELTRKARRVRTGDLEVEFNATSSDEIGTLTMALADMVQAMRDRIFIQGLLGRYANPGLAERCLADPEALELGGRLQTVTVLMSDLRGFTALTERLGPEEMIDLLNDYLGRMAAVIQAHGGTINEFIGDAILVLFGAPFERSDDCERAVRCAHAMQRELVNFNIHNATLGLPQLGMGIGLHTGPVVAGNIGSEEHAKYGVVGTTVNATARIEALTVGTQTLMSRALWDQVQEVVEVGEERVVELKGLPAPMGVVELVGIRG